MLLNDLKQKKEKKNDIEMVLLKLMEVFKSLETIEFITCIHRIQLNFKDIIEKYIRKLVNSFSQLFGEPRLHCAESILSGATLLEDLIYKKPYFIQMLEQRNSSLQHVCLKIIFELICVNKISSADTRTLLPILTSQFIQHPHVACRYRLTQILISLYKLYSNSGSTDDNVIEILKMCKNSLLKVLMDKDSTIQWMAFNFWSEKAFLSGF
jgi:DNA-dependent protein kinase catalytic subunit